MRTYDESDLLAALDEPRQVQTELVEWEEVSPRCYALKLRTWRDDTEVEG